MYKPGCMGRNEGRSQNSGGIGLLPLHSNTPSIYNLGTLHIGVNYQVYNSNVMWIFEEKKWSIYRKPSLSPRRYVCYTAMIKDPFSCSCTSIVLTTIRSFPKDTHTNVAKNRAEHDALAFYVKSPATIFILKYNKFIA